MKIVARASQTDVTNNTKHHKPGDQLNCYAEGQILSMYNDDTPKLKISCYLWQNIKFLTVLAS